MKLFTIIMICILFSSIGFAQSYGGISLMGTFVKNDLIHNEKCGNGGGLKLIISPAFYHIIGFSVDFGIEEFSDRGQFSQTVENYSSGAIGDAKSTILAFPLSLGLGIRTPVIPNKNVVNFSIGLNYGVVYFLGADRSIVRCATCRREKIKINGGNYFEPNIQIYFLGDEKKDGGINLYYRLFENKSDIKWEFGVAMVGSFD